ncbi:MAG: hypothetical protein EA384_10990 [Spirochaetaceae bacterium]|nr:MAG: hypothetical protein EA384_10990 [Spirochaetaceae bacterium]
MFFWFGFPFVFFLPVFLAFLAIRAGLAMFRPPDRSRDGLFPTASDERELLAQLESGGYAYRQLQGRQAQLFRLAQRLGGRLTVSDIVIETGLGVSEAERFIESMVDNAHVRMDIDDNGMVVYDFPEIIARRRRSADRGDTGTDGSSSG